MIPYLKTKLGKINYSIKRKSNKPYVFFIGGLGSTISSWEDQVEYYKNHFSILTFDNLGSGKSAKPQINYSKKCGEQGFLNMIGAKTNPLFSL